MADLSDLWADSQSSGKLFNIVATDFGGEVKKAVVSIGNVGLNIHRRGKRKKRERICHDPKIEQKIYQCDNCQHAEKSSSYYLTTCRKCQKGKFQERSKK